MQTEKVNKWTILVTLIAAVSITLINCGGKNPQGPTPLNVDLSGILNGMGIPGAADYVPGPVLHPIAVFGDIPITAFPEEWLAKSVSTLELVAHGDTASSIIQTCRYVPFGTVRRYDSTLKIVLYAAKSARIIARETFENIPGPCPPSASFESGEVKTLRASPIRNATIANWLAGVVTGSEVEEVAHEGGPDNFGNRWIDSDQPGGPVFDWVEISAVGTRISFTEHKFSEKVTLPPFSFPFYSSLEQRTMEISRNGFLTFGITPVGSAFNRAIPDPLLPNNVIAPFWDSLNPTTGGNVYYYHDAALNRFIVQYDNVPWQSTSNIFDTGGPYTFEVILHADGTILFQYLNMNFPLNEATIGIENFIGSDGLQIAFNSAYVHDNLAVRISK